MTTKLKGAQILCQSLINEGVETIFGFPGGAVLPLYDTLPQYPQLRHILVRHEQAAAHAADAYARVTGKVGVCFATSGPGATNLVTGIANAHLDSVPMVAITGQVARPFIGKDAFQEIDITGITVPITKHSYAVRKAEELGTIIKEAFYIANTGRPGPVLIDIPKDVFDEEANFKYPDTIDLAGYEPTTHGHPLQIKKAAKLINEAKRPVIITGRGIIISKAYSELKELAEKAQIPITYTLLGIGGFPESHVLSFGMLGMHGMAYANLAIDSADLVIAIGMRFDDRATANVSRFATQAQIIHIDIDPAEIGKNLKITVPIVGDCKNVLTELNKLVESQPRVKWIKEIEQLRHDHPSHTIRETEDLIPQYVIRQIYEITKGNATIVTGVGQHQMWSAQHYVYDKPNSLVSSGGLGTMGFELPAGMGAKVGIPNEIVWTIAGDGGFQMTIQELATIVQENIGLKIAIMNNGYLGMVRQWQELFYQRRYVATPLAGPDFLKIADAYGIPAIRVEHKIDVIPAIQKAMDTDGPFLIDFRIEPEENVYPMVAPGASLAEILEEPSKDEASLAGK
ncbi:MAG: biosynthetic-type acetolactate synthase large subunit [Chloroflexi bacterium]|nr:biosynthetic-type acetolactate synthase large subunit [Chloroflexota bacterium]